MFVREERPPRTFDNIFTKKNKKKPQKPKQIKNNPSCHLINKKEFIVFTLTSRRICGFNVFGCHFSCSWLWKQDPLKTRGNRWQSAGLERHLQGGVCNNSGPLPTDPHVSAKFTLIKSSLQCFLDQSNLYAHLCLAIFLSDVRFCHRRNYLNHIDIEINVNCIWLVSG